MKKDKTEYECHYTESNRHVDNRLNVCRSLFQFPNNTCYIRGVIKTWILKINLKKFIDNRTKNSFIIYLFIGFWWVNFSMNCTLNKWLICKLIFDSVQFVMRWWVYNNHRAFFNHVILFYGTFCFDSILREFFQILNLFHIVSNSKW